MSGSLTAGLPLVVEVDALRYVFAEVGAGRPLPVAEAEAAAYALTLEPRAYERRVLLQAVPEGREDYLPVHAVNVASLAVAFAESLEMDPDAVRLVALSGLLHDIGMSRLPAEVLMREGPLEQEERVRLKEHPVTGARVIIEADAGLELPAVVAFEHHLRSDGSGYPAIEPRRPPHRVSRMIQLCGIWHALRSERPYRPSWPPDIVLSFLAERAGFEFDAELTAAFTRLIRQHTVPVL